MSEGNMYNWVTKTWNPVGGTCPHMCSYCYVNVLKKRFPHLREKYSGKPRLMKGELKPLGKNKLIFVCSCIDLFADEIPNNIIVKVLQHCLKYPNNTYLLQSKNPHRFALYFQDFPPNVILGTTIETNIEEYVKRYSEAPSPVSRYMHMLNNFPRKMVSIEPIMDFDLHVMVRWIKDIQPEFISIGADSKGNNLPEPPAWKVERLIKALEKFTEVRIKKNLNRILREKENGKTKSS